MMDKETAVKEMLGLISKAPTNVLSGRRYDMHGDGHKRADIILLETLRSAGYGAVADAFEKFHSEVITYYFR